MAAVMESVGRNDMGLSTNQINLLGEIYQLLTKKTRENEGATASWVDPETDTIWMLGDENELIRYAAGRSVKDMSEKELTDLIAFLKKMDEEVLDGDHF